MLLRLPVCFFALCLLATPCLADTIELTNGDRLTGTVVETNDTHVVIDHPALGRIAVPKTQVARVLTPEQAVEAEAAAKAEAVEEAKAQIKAEEAAAKTAEEEPGPEDPGIQIGAVTLFKGWDRTFELGINGATGNSENVNVRAGLAGLYEDPERRWIVDAVYNRSTTSGTVSENNLYLDVTRDWLLPDEDYFFFATGRWDWDDFQDWENRLSGAGGMGYQFIKRDDLDVLGRLGIGGSQTFGGTNDEFVPEALIGLDARYKINGRQSILFSNTYYQGLNDLGEFRNLTKAEWRMKLDDEGMALKIGAENEYQSRPGGTAKRDDLKYYLSLAWDF